MLHKNKLPMFLYLVLKKYFLLKQRAERKYLVFTSVVVVHGAILGNVVDCNKSWCGLYIYIVVRAIYTVQQLSHIQQVPRSPMASIEIGQRQKRALTEQTHNMYIYILYLHRLSLKQSAFCCCCCVYYSRFFQRLFDCFRPAYIRQVK